MRVHCLPVSISTGQLFSSPSYILVKVVSFPRNGFCKSTSLRYKCEIGIRRKTYHLLTGSILSVWSQLEQVFDTRLQIFRVRTPTRRLVG